MSRHNRKTNTTNSTTGKKSSSSPATYIRAANVFLPHSFPNQAILHPNVIRCPQRRHVFVRMGGSPRRPSRGRDGRRHLRHRDRVADAVLRDREGIGIQEGGEVLARRRSGSVRLLVELLRVQSEGPAEGRTGRRGGGARYYWGMEEETKARRPPRMPRRRGGKSL
jgi:hypothetical protein